MRFSMIVVAVCLLTSGQVLSSPIDQVENKLVAREDGDFCIYFYKKPHYKDEAGFICGQLSGPGDHAGRPNANMPVVGSLTAPDWLEINLFNKKAYRGESKVVQGNQDSIDPAFNVQSFKFLYK
ncbi:hypothetical protein BCR42DRAFT_417489 [Absidia repens]|uniref:Beta/gamma crystallin 'Greek key' domain-containing protein n=1 Tax=Absidia repens TaxID=90262 RepID=A0A1X2IDV3_9FUNG|nr:hypothetical protein BCR42DRAFT_417489 [Absidia repens]